MKNPRPSILATYSGSAAQNVAALLKSLQKTGHGFQFTAADISAAPIFAHR